MSVTISTTATMNVDTTNQTNPTHKYEQAPHPDLAPERLTCDDCGTEASIDGDLPIDLFSLVVPGYTTDRPKALCLGDLANRRLLGQDLRRV